MNRYIKRRKEEARLKDLCILNDALNYIEDNLCGELSQAEIAAACCCSLSALQKLFRYAFNISVGDYITRRRLTCCARELVGTDRSVLDIALDHGYSSPEAFTRAFSRMWGEPPAFFRKERRFTGLFPKLEPCDNGGNDMSEKRRKYDVTELYDFLAANRGTFLIAFDIKGLIPINNISTKAGDVAIRESLKRIEEAAGEDMLLFRIGGDEFVLASGTSDEAEADAIAEAVTSWNGEPFVWEGRSIPLSLFSAKMKISGSSIRYSELFPEINSALDEAKRQ